MGKTSGAPQETVAIPRQRRREQLLKELAEARELRKRLKPRRTRLARERALVHAAALRR